MAIVTTKAIQVVYNLELTEQEASFLYALVGKCNGRSPSVDSIYEAFSASPVEQASLSGLPIIDLVILKDKGAYL